jgi:DNA polymerase III alpha subunit
VGIEVGTISAGELKDNFDSIAKEKKDRRFFVETLAEDLKKFPRHLSIHSGGFVLSNDPLIEMVPVEPARMEGRTIIQWDKDDLETLGLMKVDVLSIGFLTALHKACDLVDMDWRSIPGGDEKTYKMIQRAETHGTFQIESRAQMNMLVQTLPEKFYDLVVEVALVRPSPTSGGMVRPYIEGLKESRLGRPFKIGHSALEKILGRTHGIPIFQEQIMQISIDVAGFSPSEADQLRRSLGQQRTAKSVDEMGQKLYQSLIGNGIPAKFADDLFKYIQGYAHYGFPESHAASYASLAYKSAYMKCHHPDALLCGLINSQPMGFYSVDTLINEAKRSGVQFLPLHPNKSEWGVCLEKSGVVRMGFRELRRINKDDVMHLLEERRCREFSSVEDFIFRTHLSRDVLENLALANCFSCFGLDRRHSFWQSLEFAHLFDRGSGRGQAGQTSLFDERTILQQQTDFFEPMSMLEEIKVDYKKIGYSLQGNLMKGLRLELPQLPPMTSAQVRALRHGDQVQYAGILMALQRPPPAKGTAFITFEDEFGSIDTLFKNEIFEKFEEVIKGSRFLIVEGKVQKKGTGTTVVVSRAESFATFKSIGKPASPQPCPREMAALRWMK